MAQFVFDATTVQPSTGVPDPVPAGWYNAIVEETAIEPTKDGNGAFISAKFSIADGQYANRKVYHMFNVKNNSQTAVEIAYRDLSALQHAIGLLRMQDTQELHGRPLKIKVSITPADKGYDAKNAIKAFKNINEQVGNAAPGANAGIQSFTPPPQQQPQFAPPAQQPGYPPPFAPPQQQPWPNQPAQQPQFAPPPMQQPAAPQQPPQQGAQPWQQPQGQQPWQQPAAPPAAQQPQTHAAPPQQQPPAATPPWMQPQA